MWLPTPIYKRVPQFWLLLGLLFMSTGTYLGFEFSLSFVYFGVGLGCIAWSMWVFSKRAIGRREAPAPAPVPVPVPAQADVPPPAATVAQTAQPQHEGLSQGADTTA